MTSMDSDYPEVLLLQAITLESTIYQLRAESCRLRRKAHRLQRENAARMELERELATVRRLSGDMEASDEGTN